MAWRGGFLSKLANKYFEYTGHRQYGLRFEDLLIQKKPSVEEALRRLPVEEQIARDRRIKIAFDLSCKNDVLPKQKWLSAAEDKIYVEPHRLEVLKEEADKIAFRTG